MSCRRLPGDVTGECQATFDDRLELYPITSHERDVEACDLDGDGHLDLAVAWTVGAHVFLNEGDGTFAEAVVYPVAGDATSLAVAEFHAAGDLDLAVGHAAGLSILLNVGDGTFFNEIHHDIGLSVVALGAGDLDGDSDLDLILISSLDGAQVMLAQGPGVFTPGATVELGLIAGSVAVSDLDGDGDLDLAVPNRGSDTLSLLFNNGDATFAPQVTLFFNEPEDVVAADLDGNGDTDLAVKLQASGSMTETWILLNDGNGVFLEPSVVLAQGSGPLVDGDLDGDGDVDLGAARSVLHNLGQAVFAQQFPMAPPLGQNLDSALGDLDGDGDPHLASARFQYVLVQRHVGPYCGAWRRGRDGAPAT